MRPTTPFKRSPLATAVQAACYSMLLSSTVQAGPTGGSVVGGSGSIAQSGTSTTINQTTQNMAINWQSYNLNANERVQYIQPNASSVSLNSILSNNGSTIAGRIDANGKVILVNPNGIFFTPTSVINVGSLIASGLNINPADFMNGQYIFNEIPGSSGAVVNSGIINASIGGNVALIGRHVENNGLITANLGTVTLAAGKEAVLTFDDAGLLGVRVSKEILQSELGVDPAVLNSGTITASGGRVLLTASVSQDIFSKAVNTNGIQQATSVVANGDGTFSLGGGADVVNTGSIDTSTTTAANNVGRIVLLGNNISSSGVLRADAASGNGGDIELHSSDTTILTQNSVTSARSESNGNGGIVKVLGDKVGLFDQSIVDVSGAAGGGQALIGGDNQGKNTNIRNASRTFVSTGSNISADALQDGVGGKIINWSNDYTWFYGKAFSRGGSNSGNGGFVEISGSGLTFSGFVDVGAANGVSGTLLFDPTNIIVHNGSTQPNDSQLSDNQILAGDGGNATFDISETVLEALSASANVVLEATNNITINSLTDNLLGMQQTTGSVHFKANSDGIGGGTFSMNANDTIRTRGGSVTIDGASITLGSINTTGAGSLNGGDIILNVGTGTLSAVNLTSNGGASNNEVGLSAGNITITGAGQIGVTGAISALGSRGNNNGNTSYDGGLGGNVLIASTASTVQVQAISTNGGAARGGTSSANGGNAGTISLSGASINLNDILNAKGGAGVNGGAQGNGANITFTGPATLGNNIIIDTSGTTRGNINFTNAPSASTINSPGTKYALTLTGHDITFGGMVGGTAPLGGLAISASGFVNAGANDIIAASLDVTQSTSFTSGAINTSGTAGGPVGITSSGAVSVNSLNSSSTAANGGTVTLTSTGSTVSVGDINARSTQAGSSGGTVAINATGITLNGDIDKRNGNGSSQSANLTLTSPGTATINYVNNFTSPISLSASGATSILTSSNRTNDWLITGGNIGSLNTGVTFSGFGTLNGGTGIDNFTVNQNASIVTMNGGRGANTFIVNGIATTINGNGVDTVVGNNTIIINNAGSGAASVTTINAGDGNDVITLNSVTGGAATVTTVNAGNGDNNVTVNANGSVTGAITGGTGVDTIVIAGTAASVNTGDGLTNSVTVKAGGVVSGTITGGTGADTIFIDAALLPLAAGSVAAIDAKNGDNTITVNGMVIGGITTAGGVDTFNIGGTIGGVIDAGVGSDTLTITDSVNTKTVQLGSVIPAGATTNTLTINHVESITTYSGLGNTIVGAGDVSYTWTIDGATTSTVKPTSGATAENTVKFVNFSTINGGSNANIYAISSDLPWAMNGGAGGNTFNIASSYAGTLTGNTGVDNFNINTAGVTVNSVAGIGGNDTLTGPNSTAINLWSVTGTNNGNLQTTSSGAVPTTGTVNFTGINTLRGGSGDDSFSIGASGIAATIIGGLGNNTLVGRAVDTTWNVTGSNIGNVTTTAAGGVPASTYVNSYSQIQNLNGGAGADTFIIGNNGVVSGGATGIIGGGGSNKLVGRNADSTWNITGTDSGNVTTTAATPVVYVNAFSQVQNLTGGTAADTFVVAPSGAVTGTGFITGTIDGGAITGSATYNTLVASDVPNNTWLITTYNGTTYTGILGTTTGNVFSPYVASFVGIQNLNGGSAGGSTLDFSTYVGALQVNLGSITNFSGVLGNNDAGSNLIGTDFATNWTIDGSNSGKVDWISTAAGVPTNHSILFSAFSNLTGGAGADTFIFTSNVANTTTGSIAGLVSGGTGAVNEIRALSTNNYWTITGIDTGTIQPATNAGAPNGVAYASFSKIQHLTGGIGNDDYIYQNAGRLTNGLIDGGSGANNLDMSALTTVNVTLAPTTTTGALRINNIGLIKGNATDSTLTGDDATNDWQIGLTIAGINRPNQNSVTWTPSGQTVATTVQFNGFTTLNGGTGVDTFSIKSFASAASAIGVINGGDSADNFYIRGPVGIINGGNGDDFFYVDATGNVSGSLNGGSGLNGDAGNDSFTVITGGIVTNGIDGGADTAATGGAGDRVFLGAGATINLGSAYGLNGIALTGIEGVDSNGGTINARDGYNTTWNITGLDTGSVSDVNGTNNQSGVSMTFSGFNKLNGSNPNTATNGGNDIFRITGDGSISGLIDAKNGSNSLTVSLTNTRLGGQVYYKGGTGPDTITLNGISSSGDYLASTSFNGVVYDHLAYTGTNGTVFTTYYANAETISDQVNASVLTVNGTAIGTNTITLGSTTISPNSFSVNNGSAVTFTNKPNLTVVGAGTNGSVNIVSNFTVQNTLTLRNVKTINQTAGTSLASTGLSLDTVNVAGVTPASLTTGSTLLDVTNSGPISITANAGLSLNQINTAGALTVSSSGGTITSDATSNVASSGVFNLATTGTGGNITLAGRNVLSGPVSLSAAAGDISLNNPLNQLTGPLTLTAANNTVTIVNSTATNLANVTAQNLNVTSSGTGDITDSGIIKLTGTTTLAAGTNNITLDNANDFSVINVTSANTLVLNDINNIASGNLVANKINLHTASGIGNGSKSPPPGKPVVLSPSAVLYTTTSDLTVLNDGVNGGNVWIDNTGPVSASVITKGDIYFKNEGTLTVRQLNANGGSQAPAASLGGDIHLLVNNGSAFGNPDTSVNYLSTPDIVAQNFYGVLTGTPRDMGQQTRPMSIQVKDNFTLYAQNAYIHYLFEVKPLDLNINAILFEISDFTGVNGQLLEVESLGEFDPAIFTAVRNYYYEDVAIMMPADQRLDGVDEEDEKEKEKDADKVEDKKEDVSVSESSDAKS